MGTWTDVPRTGCESQSRRPTLAPTQRIRLLEQHLRYAVSFLQELPDRVRLNTDVDVRPVLKALQYWESGRSIISKREIGICAPN